MGLGVLAGLELDERVRLCDEVVVVVGGASDDVLVVVVVVVVGLGVELELFAGVGGEASEYLCKKRRT